MSRTWSLILVSCWLVAGTLALEGTPEYIRPCKRKDPQLDKCVEKSVVHLDGFLINGIEELGTPALEPLVIPRIQMENGVGRVRVKAVFSNMTIHGAGNHSITHVKSNIKDLKIDLGMKIPKITATGRYEISGTVLVAQIRSKGEFWASFDDISAAGRLVGKEMDVKGLKYLFVEKLPVDFKVGKARFRVKDRSTNSRLLGEAINNFLNQNWREVLDEMKQTASSSISKYFRQILNKALLQIPINRLLTED